MDVGSGTGLFALAIAEWFDVDVVAVEPTVAMRQQAIRRRSHPRIAYLAGEAERLPLGDGSCGAAWLSTVIHHITDLPSSARELRRVLCPGAPVLVRSAFPGRLDRVTLFRLFPGAREIAEAYPSVEDTVRAFGTASFRMERLESVAQVTATSLKALPQSALRASAAAGRHDAPAHRR